MDAPKPMLNRTDAAEYCGLSSTAFDALVRPFVPVIVIGRIVLFRVSDLDTFLDSRARVPQSWDATVALAKGA